MAISEKRHLLMKKRSKKKHMGDIKWSSCMDRNPWATDTVLTAYEMCYFHAPRYWKHYSLLILFCFCQGTPQKALGLWEIGIYFITI